MHGQKRLVHRLLTVGDEHRLCPVFRGVCSNIQTRLYEISHGRLARRDWSRSHVKLSDRAFNLFVTFVLLAVMLILAVIVYRFVLQR